jgi:hypothetical protein
MPPDQSAEPSLPAVVRTSHPSDAIWYVLAALAAAWVIWGPIEDVMRSLTFAAILIGCGAGLFAERAITQAFPERDTRYLRVIFGIVTAAVAGGLVWMIRIGGVLSSSG